MAYCTHTELAAITGSDLGQTILEALITQGDREIDAFLDLYGITGSSSISAVKAASLKLGQAGVYELAGEGAAGNAGPALPWSQQLRQDAWEILKRYITSSESTTIQTSRVLRVDGI